MQKVFCVGLWKTGTKSIGEAFRSLGYRTSSNFMPVIKDINMKSIEELHNLETWRNALERISHAMNAYDAFSDTPWHFVYKYALSQYPDAKFVLTTRKNAEDYASSEHAHCQAHNMPSDQIPSREFFVDRYHYHNSMIIRSIPPERLLICPIENMSWSKLCVFLEKEIPDTPFPHFNKRITLEN